VVDSATAGDALPAQVIEGAGKSVKSKYGVEIKHHRTLILKTHQHY
jgi:hypothetical protein